MGDSALSWVPVVGTAINAWSQERNLEENAIQSRIQREWQEEMWNKNNHYNTPSAQKSRLEAAGVNPYSVLAQGGADTGVSSSPAQSYERAKADFHSPMNEDAFLNQRLIAAQTRGQELSNENVGIHNQFARDKEIWSLREQMERVQTERTKQGLNSSQKKMYDLEYDSLNARFQSLVNQSEAESRILTMVADNKERELEDAHNESVVRQNLASANIELSYAEMQRYLADIRRIHEEVVLLQKQQKLTDEQAKLIEKQKLTEVTKEVVMRHDSARREGEFWRGMYDSDYNNPLYPNNNAGSSSLEGGIIGSIVTSLLSRGSSTVVRGFK